MKPSEKAKWIFVKIISATFKFLLNRVTLFFFYLMIYAAVFFMRYDLNEITKPMIIYHCIFFPILFELMYFIFLKKTSAELIKGFDYYLKKSKKILKNNFFV
jgi:hypothetical protein